MLGVLLYEMVTGQRPFKGDTSVSIISAILKDTPGSVTNLRPDLPRDLAKILKCALNKDPEHRYQSVKDLRNDLEMLKEDLDSGEIVSALKGPALRRRRLSRPLVMAGLLLLAITLAFGTRGESNDRISRWSWTPLPERATPGHRTGGPSPS